MSCQTCPSSENELIKNLDPGYFPELIDVSSFLGPEKRIILDYVTDIYTEHLKLLLSAKSTGRFTDDIDDEILDCRDALDWLESIKIEN